MSDKKTSLKRGKSHKRKFDNRNNKENNNKIRTAIICGTCLALLQCLSKNSIYVSIYAIGGLLEKLL